MITTNRLKFISAICLVELQLPQRKWSYTEFEQHSSKKKFFSFELISFNVLSQDLLELNPYLYTDCMPKYLDWDYRKKVIMKQIIGRDADIVCLQEAQEDHYENYFCPKLKKHGYESLFIKRSGEKTDGCALFYKTHRLLLVDYKSVPFHHPNIELLDRDNVGLIALFKPKMAHASSDDLLCVACTHLLFSPKRGDIKLAQLQYFLAEIDRLSVKDNNIDDESSYYPIILCGDFNSQPYSPLYQFLVDGYIKYDRYRRIEISGQTSSNNYSLYLPSKELIPSCYVQSDCRFPTRTKITEIIEQKTMNIVVNEKDLEIIEEDVVNEKDLEIIEEDVDEKDLEIIEEDKDVIFYKEYLKVNNVNNSSSILTHNKKFYSVYKHFDSSNTPEVTSHAGYDIQQVDFIFYTTGGNRKKTTVTSTNEQQKPARGDRLNLVGRYNLYYQNQLNSILLPNWQEALQGQSIKRLNEKGVCVNKLRYQYSYTGLYGRHIIVFDGEYLTTRTETFSPGDIASIYRNASEINEKSPIANGVIFRVTNNSIHIALDENDNGEYEIENETCQFMLIKIANDVTYRRLKRILEKLLKDRNGRAQNLLDIAFENSEPNQIESQSNSKQIEYFNQNLDESQREAIKFALQQRDIAVIHGPPGTGKTTTVVEYIFQATLKYNLKVLCCAPSNIAVDNLVERLSQRKQLRQIRLGHPARMLESIQKFSLESIVTQHHNDVKSALREDLDKCFMKVRKCTNRGEREQLRHEIRLLRKDIREYEEKASRDALKSVNVVLCTLTSANDDGPLKLLPLDYFDVVVIDECSQALEIACWIPLLRASKCVLAGDHLQLPPTILSEKAAKDGLDITLMKRLIDQFNDKITRMLTVQYRMNEKIMNWSSNEFYHGKLTAHSSVQHHLLSDLPNIVRHEDENDNISKVPLLLIDTSGCDMNELQFEDEISRANEGEASLVAHYVKILVEQYGVELTQLGIISPYNLQVDLLRKKLLTQYPALEIRSVDGFQGREKEIIIISMVRSNKQGRGLTRTVSRDPFIKRLIDYIQINGDVRSAHEYIHDENFSDESTLTKTMQKVSLKSNQSKTASKSNKIRQQPSSHSKFKENMNSVQNDRFVLIISNDDKTELEQVLDQRLITFLNDNHAYEIVFETSLSNYGRKYVHSLAEMYNLNHRSEGIDEDRHIIVSKKSIVKEKQQSDDGTSTNDEEEKSFRTFSSLAEHEPKKSKQSKKNKLKEEHSEIVINPDISIENENKSENIESTVNVSNENICPYCKKSIPIQNYQLHELYCQRINQTPSTLFQIKDQANTQISSSVKEDKTINSNSVSSKKQKQSHVPPSRLLTIDKSADFDTIIEAARQHDNICNYQKCKIKITLLGQLCSYCNHRFCFEHSMPEVHGCGQTARKDMRSAHLSAHSNPTPVYSNSQPIKKEKRPYLERKLQSKIAEKETDRKKKSDK
ncbi:unnamed protein product [Didymodactylos carnosus]|uniref:DNA helicase n=1 Tax=Didymodactylos carnosus TaxID=1234261 RepID=A0A814GYV3_9BILA|nr:unnamed protein product [Didymodactylos carnosus]CAF1002360.1 unnamed protein product [Didymodactylos carnosus]CAF3749770.1 unnamed protein product [Didymodactylos carnosus]CAF3773778.1 unnamed protein product [Didymodactylos carnosus]